MPLLRQPLRKLGPVDVLSMHVCMYANLLKKCPVPISPGPQGACGLGTRLARLGGVFRQTFARTVCVRFEVRRPWLEERWLHSLPKDRQTGHSDLWASQLNEFASDWPRSHAGLVLCPDHVVQTPFENLSRFVCAYKAAQSKREHILCWKVYDKARWAEPKPNGVFSRREAFCRRPSWQQSVKSPSMASAERTPLWSSQSIQST